MDSYPKIVCERRAQKEKKNKDSRTMLNELFTSSHEEPQLMVPVPAAASPMPDGRTAEANQNRLAETTVLSA